MQGLGTLFYFYIEAYRRMKLVGKKNKQEP